MYREHPSIVCNRLSFTGSHRGWSWSQLTLGEQRGTPWTSQYRSSQGWHVGTNINLTCTSLDCGRRTQTSRGNMYIPHRKAFESRSWTQPMLPYREQLMVNLYIHLLLGVNVLFCEELNQEGATVWMQQRRNSVFMSGAAGGMDQRCVHLILCTAWQLNRTFTHQIKAKWPLRQRYRTKQQ